MLFKEIEYWNGKEWKKLDIKTDSLKVVTKNHIVDIVDDKDAKRLQISSRINKNMEGRPQVSFISFID